MKKTTTKKRVTRATLLKEMCDHALWGCDMAIEKHRGYRRDPDVGGVAFPSILQEWKDRKDDYRELRDKLLKRL